jgi:sugar/nucleoside kinase (ribokinase family)
MVKYSTWQTWPICTSNDKTGILRLTRKSGVKTVVNIGIQDCQKDINELMDFIENADIIILNALEFATLVKKSPEHLDVSKDVATLAHLRPKQILIVTDGKNGSYVYKWRNFLSGGKSWNHNC